MIPESTYSSNTECHEVLCASLQDETEYKHADHNHETLSATPKIEDLGHGNVACSSESTSHGADNGQHRVRAESAGSVGGHGAVDCSSETASKCVKPDTKKC